ncbi:MAG TPA: hypothetical protein VGW74_13580, partial [Propionibacteriaceae bacterium]|nr:hypothetical protein [Propionibacteriaceae bacterium]
MSRTTLPAAMLVVGLVLLVGCTTAPKESSEHGGHADPAGYMGGSSLPEPYTMPDVTLIDTAGRPYNLA